MWAAAIGALAGLFLNRSNVEVLKIVGKFLKLFVAEDDLTR